NPAKIALDAALLKPIFRFVKRFGPLMKLIVVGTLLYFGWQAFVAIAAGTGGSTSMDQGFTIVVLYLAVFVICYFIEMRKRIKLPLSALHKESDEFKNLALVYVYEGQQAQVTATGPSFRAIRVAATAKSGVSEEITAPAGPDLSKGPGTFFLAFG